MKQGFSLVELSIVLVILGLLTGGILAGQSLIRAAELRSLSVEHQRYVTAIHSFRGRYSALPGDMPNAVRFWGAQAGGLADGVDATCAALTVGATDQRTCNGNGNGRVTYSPSVVENGYEMMRAWQHLANAGLIEGSYTGVTANTASGYTHVPGLNCLASRLSRTGWGIRTTGLLADGTEYFTLEYGNELMVGVASTNGIPVLAGLKPEEAWGFDLKIDDGMPGKGKVIANRITTCTDATSVTDYEAPYKLSSSAIGCSLRFPNAF